MKDIVNFHVFSEVRKQEEEEAAFVKAEEAERNRVTLRKFIDQFLLDIKSGKRLSDRGTLYAPSTYWGTPLPIWRTEDGNEEICIGSVAQLREEIEKSVKAGFMKENPYKSEDYTKFDLHRPYIDGVVLCSASGKKMFREPDLIDVWFDSGAMPYAQIHYMGKPGQLNDKTFPADFIAEGVDQTRGWFFTLHAIATMCFDSVAYKNVISNGLVLDKNGNKMSKRLGNAVDPFEIIHKYGPDATRLFF